MIAKQNIEISTIHHLITQPLGKNIIIIIINNNNNNNNNKRAMIR